MKIKRREEGVLRNFMRSYEGRIVVLAVCVLLLAFYARGSETQQQAEEGVFALEAGASLHVKYDPEAGQLFVRAECTSALKPVSKLTGMVFNVQLCR